MRQKKSIYLPTFLPTYLPTYLTFSKMSASEDQPQSEVNYFWFIAFEWCVSEPKPFQIFVREYFGDDDIPDTWFSGVLTEEYRLIKLQLNAVAGNNPYSIFAKVEKGMYSICNI